MDDVLVDRFDYRVFTPEDWQLLQAFHQRRKIFDDFLSTFKSELITCPGCGFPTISSRAYFEICDVCFWEDDGQDDENADEIWRGANRGLSLTENRLQIGRRLNPNSPYDSIPKILAFLKSLEMCDENVVPQPASLEMYDESVAPQLPIIPNC